MRAALARQRRDGVALTRSELERRFLTLVEQAGLPRPRTNVHRASVKVDAYWPSRRLVVELDGWAFHRTAAQFQRDHDKDNLLRDRGYELRRFTHHDVVNAPERVVARLRPLLRSR